MTRRGFTLVELLAATALAVMLAAGALRVVASIRADVAAQRDRSLTDGTASDQLVDLIRRDLTQARSFTQAGGKVVLIGFGGVNRADFDGAKSKDAASHQPVKIEYFVKQLGEVNWLVRRQTDLNVLNNRNAWTELARANVRSIEVRPLKLGTADQGTRTSLAIKDDAPPDQVRLVIASDDQNTMNIDTVMTLR
ncbi:prepilin-type N-terminal cleavage/methylation domain-containing protein [Planctomycetales bacterium ZRK34]|nr:prepilin-type N-terminal cleavage/methylation domain-containing protein [Planctomycetales bacterium ZRK34]